MKCPQLYFSFVDWEIFEFNSEAFANFIGPVIKQVLNCYGTSQYIFTDFENEENLPEGNVFVIPMTVVVGDKNQLYFPFMRKLEEERWAGFPVKFNYELPSNPY